MIFIETTAFTRTILSLLKDEEYRELQETLMANPGAGKVIRGSGGIRKMRWAVRGKGKRGGLRVIYYWVTSDEQILLLLAYPKSKQEDLTSKQVSLLKKLVEEYLE